MCVVVRLVALGVLALPGCSWLVPGEGAPPDAGFPSRELTIVAVDGTGSELPPSGGPDDATPARRRLRDALVVEGAGLREVTKVSLVSAAGESRYENLDFERFAREGAPDVSLRVSLPAGVRAGLYTLTLVAAAHDASAQVFLLQGEPGPAGSQGETGARGPAGVSPLASLTRVVALPVGDAACPKGGARVLAGTDLDGDAFLDDEEVETEADACHGDPGLACASGACVLAADLEVEGRVYVDGPAGLSLPLARQVEGPIELGVGPSPEAKFADLHTALASLDDVRIAADASVTFRLEAGEHTYTSPIGIRHPDGARIRIVGADPASPASTVLVFTPPDPRHGVAIVGSDLGALDGLTLRYQGPAGSHGVHVEGGRVQLGPSLNIQGFDVGVAANGGAVVVANGSAAARLIVTGHVTGISAHTAEVQANFAILSSPQPIAGTVGLHANLAARIYADTFVAVGHTFGGLASFDSMIHAPRGVVSGPGAATDTKGFLSQYSSSIVASQSTVTNVRYGYQAVHQASVLATGHGAATGVTTPYCAIADSSVVQAAGGLTVACP